MTSWPRSTRRVSPAEVAGRDQRGDLIVLVALRRWLVRLTGPDDYALVELLDAITAEDDLRGATPGQQQTRKHPPTTQHLKRTEPSKFTGSGYTQRSPTAVRSPCH